MQQDCNSYCLRRGRARTQIIARDSSTCEFHYAIGYCSIQKALVHSNFLKYSNLALLTITNTFFLVVSRIRYDTDRDDK